MAVMGEHRASKGYLHVNHTKEVLLDKGRFHSSEANITDI